MAGLRCTLVVINCLALITCLGNGLCSSVSHDPTPVHLLKLNRVFSSTLTSTDSIYSNIPAAESFQLNMMKSKCDSLGPCEVEETTNVTQLSMVPYIVVTSHTTHCTRLGSSIFILPDAHSHSITENDNGMNPVRLFCHVQPSQDNLQEARHDRSEPHLEVWSSDSAECFHLYCYDTVKHSTRLMTVSIVPMTSDCPRHFNLSMYQDDHCSTERAKCYHPVSCEACIIVIGHPVPVHRPMLNMVLSRIPTNTRPVYTHISVSVNIQANMGKIKCYDQRLCRLKGATNEIQTRLNPFHTDTMSHTGLCTHLGYNMPKVLDTHDHNIIASDNNSYTSHSYRYVRPSQDNSHFARHDRYGIQRKVWNTDWTKSSNHLHRTETENRQTEIKIVSTVLLTSNCSRYSDFSMHQDTVTMVMTCKCYSYASCEVNLTVMEMIATPKSRAIEDVDLKLPIRPKHVEYQTPNMERTNDQLQWMVELLSVGILCASVLQYVVSSPNTLRALYSAWLGLTLIGLYANVFVSTFSQTCVLSSAMFKVFMELAYIFQFKFVIPTCTVRTKHVITSTLMLIATGQVIDVLSSKINCSASIILFTSNMSGILPPMILGILFGVLCFYVSSYSCQDKFLGFLVFTVGVLLLIHCFPGVFALFFIKALWRKKPAYIAKDPYKHLQAAELTKRDLRIIQNCVSFRLFCTTGMRILILNKNTWKTWEQLNRPRRLLLIWSLRSQYKVGFLNKHTATEEKTQTQTPSPPFVRYKDLHTFSDPPNPAPKLRTAMEPEQQASKKGFRLVKDGVTILESKETLSVTQTLEMVQPLFPFKRLYLQSKRRILQYTDVLCRDSTYRLKVGSRKKIADEQQRFYDTRQGKNCVEFHLPLGDPEERRYAKALVDISKGTRGKTFFSFVINQRRLNLWVPHNVELQHLHHLFAGLANENYKNTQIVVKNYQGDTLQLRPTTLIHKLDDRILKISFLRVKHAMSGLKGGACHCFCTKSTTCMSQCCLLNQHFVHACEVHCDDVIQSVYSPRISSSSHDTPTQVDNLHFPAAKICRADLLGLERCAQPCDVQTMAQHLCLCCVHKHLRPTNFRLRIDTDQSRVDSANSENPRQETICGKENENPLSWSYTAWHRIRHPELPSDDTADFIGIQDDSIALIRSFSRQDSDMIFNLQLEHTWEQQSILLDSQFSIFLKGQEGDVTKFLYVQVPWSTDNLPSKIGYHCSVEIDALDVITKLDNWFRPRKFVLTYVQDTKVIVMPLHQPLAEIHEDIIIQCQSPCPQMDSGHLQNFFKHAADHLNENFWISLRDYGDTPMYTIFIVPPWTNKTMKVNFPLSYTISQVVWKFGKLIPTFRLTPTLMGRNVEPNDPLTSIHTSMLLPLRLRMQGLQGGSSLLMPGVTTCVRLRRSRAHAGCFHVMAQMTWPCFCSRCGLLITYRCLLHRRCSECCPHDLNDQLSSPSPVSSMYTDSDEEEYQFHERICWTQYMADVFRRIIADHRGIHITNNDDLDSVPLPICYRDFVSGLQDFFYCRRLALNPMFSLCTPARVINIMRHIMKFSLWDLMSRYPRSQSINVTLQFPNTTPSFVVQVPISFTIEDMCGALQTTFFPRRFVIVEQAWGSAYVVPYNTPFSSHIGSRLFLQTYTFAQTAPTHVINDVEQVTMYWHPQLLQKFLALCPQQQESLGTSKVTVVLPWSLQRTQLLLPNQWTVLDIIEILDMMFTSRIKVQVQDLPFGHNLALQDLTHHTIVFTFEGLMGGSSMQQDDHIVRPSQGSASTQPFFAHNVRGDPYDAAAVWSYLNTKKFSNENQAVIDRFMPKQNWNYFQEQDIEQGILRNISELFVPISDFSLVVLQQSQYSQGMEDLRSLVMPSHTVVQVDKHLNLLLRTYAKITVIGAKVVDQTILLHDDWCWYPHTISLTTVQVRIAETCAGVGGFSIPLSLLGYNTICANERNSILHEALQTNHPNTVVVPGDVGAKDFLSTLMCKNINVLMAGFPCQPYSKQGGSLGLRDTRSATLFKILSQALFAGIHTILLENTDYIATHQHFNILIRVIGCISGKFLRHVTIPLNLLWPARRTRWFAILSNQELPEFQLIRSNIPTLKMLSQVNFDDVCSQDLSLSTDEKELYYDIRFGVMEERMIAHMSTIPTLLHSYGNIHTRCPCECRSTPIPFDSLRKRGLRGVFTDNGGRTPIQFLSIKQATLYTGFLSCMVFGSGQRLALASLGQSIPSIMCCQILGYWLDTLSSNEHSKYFHTFQQVLSYLTYFSVLPAVLITPLYVKLTVVFRRFNMTKELTGPHQMSLHALIYSLFRVCIEDVLCETKKVIRYTPIGLLQNKKVEIFTSHPCSEDYKKLTHIWQTFLARVVDENKEICFHVVPPWTSQRLSVFVKRGTSPQDITQELSNLLGGCQLTYTIKQCHPTHNICEGDTLLIQYPGVAGGGGKGTYKGYKQPVIEEDTLMTKDPWKHQVPWRDNERATSSTRKPPAPKEDMLVSLLRNKGVVEKHLVNHAKFIIQKLGRKRVLDAVEHSDGWNQLVELAKVSFIDLLPKKVLKQDDEGDDTTHKINVDLDFKNLEILVDSFQYEQDSQPVQLIRFDEVQKDCKGLALATPQQAEAFLGHVDFSNQPLALLTIGKIEKHGSTQHATFRVALKHSIQGTLHLFECTLVQLGSTKIIRTPSAMDACLPEPTVAMLIIIHIEKDDSWDDWSSKPVQRLFEDIPQLQDSLVSVLKKVIYRQWQTIKLTALIKKSLKDTILNRSGMSNYYTYPLMPNSDLDTAYKPIWLDSTDIHEARTKARLDSRTLGVVRRQKFQYGELKIQIGVRVHADHFQEVRKIILGVDEDYVHSRLRFILTPTPLGADRGNIQALLKPMGWRVRPLITVRDDPCSWLLGAEEPPPQRYIHSTEGDMLILDFESGETKQKSVQFNLSASSSISLPSNTDVTFNQHNVLLEEYRDKIHNLEQRFTALQTEVKQEIGSVKAEMNNQSTVVNDLRTQQLSLQAQTQVVTNQLTKLSTDIPLQMTEQLNAFGRTWAQQIISEVRQMSNPGPGPSDTHTSSNETPARSHSRSPKRRSF